MLQSKILILKLATIDTAKNRFVLLFFAFKVVNSFAVSPLSPSAVVLRDVTTLDHEVRNQAMEEAALVSNPQLSRAKCPKFVLLVKFIDELLKLWH